VSVHRRRSAPIAGPKPPLGSASAPPKSHAGAWSGALWIAQGVLAGVLAAAGAVKLATPTPELAKMFAWTAEVPPRLVTLVAAAELAAALAVIVPPWTRMAALLSQVAAAGVASAMVFAAALHLARDEMTAFRAALVMAGLATLVACGRFRLARRAAAEQPMVNNPEDVPWRAASIAPVGRALEAPRSS
jgi:hypothetical protein